MIELSVRVPLESDATAIIEIDRAGLATGHASFRSEHYTWERFVSAYLEDSGIALVADMDGELVGWAGVVSVSDCCVYSGVGETSIYVSPRVQGQGIGKRLLQELAKVSERDGYWTLIAQLFPENTSSLALHKACGYRVVGRRERLGHMDYGPESGKWRDTLLCERRSAIAGID